MSLAAGTRLGPYEIQSPLGAGGMGEVYRARDTRLDRTVAVKVLHSQLVATADLRARFEREARVISQLQHPNICVLHDVGADGDTNFLVMEFLEGESLAERLRKGPLPAKELLEIAIELADALEKAHRAGVVHRDLKPGNVMLTRTGAKLLDFGLAKPMAAGVTAQAGSGASVFAALTQTSPAPSPASPVSAAGSVIGTMQYMSPEQVQGMEADARSDIFAFGVMLFEMATGKRAFEGKTQASIVGSILAVDPPPVSTLRSDVAPALERTIRLCLEKDPDERIQSAHDLKLQLQGVVESAAATPAVTAASAAGWRKWLPWAAAAALAVVAAALAWAYLGAPRAPALSVHSYILPPDKSVFALAGTAAGFPAVSPDGSRLAFSATGADGKQRLWIQPLNSAVAQAMNGTEGATYPFWSPDSRYVAFFANGKLNKIDANGGPPQALCDAISGRGGTWNRDGVIVFAGMTTTGLMRVDAGGGSATPLTTLALSEDSHRWPDFLPDGKHYLYFSHAGTEADSGVYLASLDSKDKKLLLHNGSNAIYAPPGYLLFVRDNELMAQPFDAAKLQLAGEAQPVADHVAANGNVWHGVMTASSNGVLLYQSGSTAGASQLVWFDRSGVRGKDLLGDPGDYVEPELSPDNSKLALQIDSAGNPDIWVIDLVRETRTRITFGPPSSTWPAWWPDGKSVVYATNSGGANAVFRKNADGTGAPVKLLEDEPGVTQFPFSVSPDGHYLVYMRSDPKAKSDFDIWAAPLSGGGKPFPVVATKFVDATPALSPDGKWMAYNTNESGRMEVYIQPFPSGPGRWQVSTGGGVRPAWRNDGKELYFKSRDQQIAAVDISTNNGSLQLGTPHPLFKADTVSAPTGPFAVANDGKRFLVNVAAEQSSQPLTLITNWTADLRK